MPSGLETATPGRFPLDAHVFEGVVLDPAVPYDQKDGAIAAGWAVRLQVTSRIHVPSSGEAFDVVILRTQEDCALATLTRKEHADRFRNGDTLRVVAFPYRKRTLLARDLRLPEAGGDRVRDAFSYYWSLLRLESLTDDKERLPLLREMALYVEDREEFAELLKQHVEQRSLRRQLLKVHKALRERGGGR